MTTRGVDGRVERDVIENIGMFVMDLSKAFGCIPYKRVIAKLHTDGLSRDKSSFIVI